MNKVQEKRIRQPHPAKGIVPRNRAAAAVELVRLEFDRQRIERELYRAQKRQTELISDLERQKERSLQIIKRLNAREFDR